MVFLQSLKIMGLGMLGIFAVTAILILLMKILTKLFPEKQQIDNGQSEN